jgi:O-antigen ligase
MLVVGLVGVLWADKPSAVVVAIAVASGYMAACAAMSRILLKEPRRNVFHIAEGFWIGLLAGLLYLGFEIFSGQVIKLTLYRLLEVPQSWLRPYRYFTWHGGRLAAISPMDLTRSIAPVTLLLWSALLALQATAPGGRSRTWSAILYFLAGVIVFSSEHGTSMVAFVCSTAVYLFAAWRPLWGNHLLKAGWVMACLAVVPATLALHRMELHMRTEVPFTLRHRIVIWNYTAEQTMKSPILGIGAGMMYQLDPAGVRPEPDLPFNRLAPHAHNVYLQTWFELGAVGAALLTLLGLSILERIRLLSDRIAPFAQATFTSAMVMAAASYGMWQAWFLAMFAQCAVMFVVALRAVLPASTAAAPTSF